MKWMLRHADSITAIAAIATPMIAIIALIGVKYQLDATEELQRAQSARDAYRSHLALAVAYPGFSRPENICAILDGEESGSYEAFVDHLLYSAEQMLEVESGWQATFLSALQDHAEYLCGTGDYFSSSKSISELLRVFKSNQCVDLSPCQS